MSNYIQSAFSAICQEARDCETWYVCLMESHQYYGGPEEGGWWGTDTRVESYQAFNNEADARAAATRVESFAQELQAESKKAYGEQCLRELSWLEARGLDADWLAEPDGPSEYSILVSQGIPDSSFGPRHYE